MHSHCFADMFNLSKHFDRLAHRISHEAWNFFPSPMGWGRPYICRFPEGGGRGKWIDWSVTDAELFNQNPYIHRYPNHSRRRRLSHTYYLPRDDRWWMNWSENACMAFLYGKDTEYWYTTSAIDCFADARRINESRKWRGCLPVSAAKGRNEIFIILFFLFVCYFMRDIKQHQTVPFKVKESFFYSMGFDGTEIKERCESFGMMGMTCWLGECLPSNAIAVGVSNRSFFRLAHHSLAVKRLWLLDSLL